MKEQRTYWEGKGKPQLMHSQFRAPRRAELRTSDSKKTPPTYIINLFDRKAIKQQEIKRTGLKTKAGVQ
jgi:hypothetical protein